MNQNCFTVYDSKAECYLPPFFLPHKGQAIRIFTDCVKSPDHQFGAHPYDYTLFQVGFFDDNTGLFQTHAPKSLGNGIEFAQVVEPIPEHPDHENSNATPIRADSQSGNSAE